MPSTTSEPPSPGPSTANSNSNYQNQAIEPIGITPQIAPDIITLPTVLITYKHPLTSQPRSVKARIDRNVPLDEVVRQLCTSAQLAINEPAHHFSLRDASNNELITNENVHRKVSNGCMTLKLVPSPTLEAKEMAEILSNNLADDKMIKLMLFSLKDYLREADFTAEFEARGGSLALARLCEQTSAGNTLAYALSALQVLAEQDRANDLFTPIGLHRFAHLLSTSALVNVLRPTTAVIRRLVSAENGFETVWPALDSTLDNEEEQRTEEILSVLAKRVAGATNADFGLAQVTLALVNELIRGSLLTSDRDTFINFEEALEKAGMSKSVIRLQEGAPGESDGLVLGYQTLSGQLFTKLREMVVSSEYERDVNKLMEMADRACELDSKADENQDELEEREARKWKTLGFESENLLDDFENVGSLGLKLMYRFITVHTPEFDKFILEELSRPEAKRCPFAKASNKCAEILAEIYEWNATETSQAPRLNMATAYQPLMIQLPKLHSHVLKFFRLMWSASGATTHDFTRVGVLVRSHLSNVLRGIAITGTERQGSRPQWAELIRELETVDYVRVRDRQMQELALEDSLLNKPPVRNLRGKLYQDSVEFIKSQRINSLMQGSWFVHSSNIPNQLNTSHNHNTRNQKNSTTPTLGGAVLQQQQQAKWRFYRLAPNKKYLHYLESQLPTVPVKNGVDEMPDRIEISSITEIISGNGAPELPQSAGIRNLTRRSSTHSTTSTTTDSSPTTPQLSHPLNHHHHNTIPKLALMGAGQTLAILIPSSVELHAEWLDGLNLLREDGAMVATKESAQLVFTLTQIGTQIKLLDLSGERVEIPNHLEIPAVPISTDFFYSEGANSNNLDTNQENHQQQQVIDPV